MRNAVVCALGALLVVSAALWLAGPPRSRGAAPKSSGLDAAAHHAPRDARETRAAIVRRDERASAGHSAIEPGREELPTAADLARAEIELHALLEHLVRLDELRDV